MLSVLYMFVSAAFVANAVVRDDETGFGPILRATPISKTQYLFGRYAGAALVAALGFLAVPAALWLGTLMPWVDPEMFEPNRLSAYLLPFLCFALPDLFLSSALLFALATMTRSMVATYVGVIALLMFWRVENQAYIAYQKGELAMFRLKEEIGAGRVDAALRRYLDRFKFRSAPFPRSVDLLAEFRKGASPAENQLITDLFEKITLYDIRTKAAAVRRLADGRYETTLTLEAHKYYADGKGRETEAPLAETIGFGLFTAMPGSGPFEAKNVLALRRLKVRAGVQQARLVTTAKPLYAGVDPYGGLIDRKSDDNITATTE
jgi:hypothetical protein